LAKCLPRVESAYLVKKDQNSRAIAGLSMGGSESLLTGLNNLDKFAWVGAFSSGGIPEEFDKDFPKLDAKANSQLKVLWIACGVDDRLIELNRKLRSWLTRKAFARWMWRRRGRIRGWFGGGIWWRLPDCCFADHPCEVQG